MRVTRRGFTRLCGGAVGVGAMGVVAACGGARDGEGRGRPVKEAVTIEWFNTGDAPDEGRNRLIAQFREKHPNVVPQVSLGGANNNEGYRAKLKTLIASDTAPDVFYLEWFIYPPYVVQGALADIDTLAKRDKLPLNDLWPAFAKQFTYKGKLWAFTQGMQTMVTWFNVDLFENAGLKPPTKGTTWVQFQELAQKLTVRQGSEITQFGTGYWRALHQPPGALMFAAGGRLFDRMEDPQASTFHEQAEQEALTWMADLANKHRVAPTAAEENALGGNDKAFTTGKFAMNMRNLPINTWEQLMKDYRWSAAPLPAGKSGQVSVANGHGTCMSAASKKKDAAWEFMGWYGGQEGQSATARELAALPGLRTAAQKSYLTEPKYAAIKPVILESIENGKWFPNTTKTNEALTTINPTIGQVLNGQITPREAGEKLRKEVDAILKGS
ncbi:MAG TPA: sugar ABC transporter substrate-binding protein [Chloroflexota bacterium]|nr:sugar ABC transporter substrate-binding protein [Chloroflexota bacterium]